MTGVPTGSSRSSSTANASIETVADDAAALARDEHLGAGQVAAEAVRVADRDDADPRLALGDEAAAVAGRLAGPQELRRAPSSLVQESTGSRPSSAAEVPNGESP